MPFPARISNRRTRRWLELPRAARSGVSAVEFALIAPLLFMVFFASIEFSRLNHVVNTVANAAYAGCRRGIVPGATVASAKAEAEAILSAGLIKDATITVSPDPLVSSSPTVSVTVSAPMNSNGWAPPTFTRNKVISRTCKLTREKTN